MRPTKRRRRSSVDACEELSVGETQKFLRNAKRVVVFTGAGISLSSGVSTFQGNGGLYALAAKQLGIKNGMDVFKYSFFKKRRSDAHQFFAGMMKEVKNAKPSGTHVGLAEMPNLFRCYTLNVDGLHCSHISTWSPENNPDGKLIEMHGNVLETVCESEDEPHVFPFDALRMKRMARGEVPKCKICGESLRPRVMLYEDENGENICEDWESQLKIDVPKSDLFLWIGISFKQAASLEYFREVRRILMSTSTDEHGLPYHIVVNPCSTAAENLESALCRDAHSEIKYARFKSDDLFSLSSLSKDKQQSS